jgi:hypothetical protein
MLVLWKLKPDTEQSHLSRILSYEHNELLRNKNELELYEKEIERVALMIRASQARINSINKVFFEK